MYVPAKPSSKYLWATFKKALIEADPSTFGPAAGSQGPMKAAQESAKRLCKIQGILDNERKITAKIKKEISKGACPQGNVAEWIEERKKILREGAEFDYHKYLQVVTYKGKTIEVPLLPAKETPTNVPPLSPPHVPHSASLSLPLDDPLSPPLSTSPGDTSDSTTAEEFELEQYASMLADFPVTEYIPVKEEDGSTLDSHDDLLPHQTVIAKYTLEKDGVQLVKK